MRGHQQRSNFKIMFATLFGSLITSVVHAKTHESVPGQFIVKLKPSVNVAKIFSNRNLNSTYAVNVLSDQLGSYVKGFIPEQNIVVVVRPLVEREDNAIAFLQDKEIVKYAEPNFIYHLNKTSNDPLFNQMWGLKNTGEKDPQGDLGVAGHDISAEAAWEIETGSAKTVIAVIDSGVLFENEEFNDNIWTNLAELNGKPGVDDDNNGVIDDIHGYNAANETGNPLDDHGHGSHCSGIIGAKGNDGKGLVGVNWNTKIMPVKFLDKNGSGSLETAVKAINYATKMGAKIMSNSWGGGGYSQALKESIEFAHSKGILFVAAAGNDSSNNDSSPAYPASYDVPNILTVAAINNKGEIADFSNFGKKSVHVGAPGVHVYSLTTTGYQSWSGTSMATPHVSGIAGLLASHFPNMSGMEIKNRIISTARPIAGLTGKVKTNGLANAYAALANIISPPDLDDPVNWNTTEILVETPHPYTDSTKLTLQVSVPNAKEISLYFEKFQTEGKYDLLTIFDSSGKEIEKLSGTHSETFSAVIPGDSARLEFSSDSSVDDFGFKISKAAYR